MITGNQLLSVYTKLSKGDQEFASSLIAQAATKKGLSEKQQYWMDKLYARATEVKPEPVAVDVGDFSGVCALFVKASVKLKYPKIRLQLPDGQQVALTRAGSAAAEPGSINVTDGGPYGMSKYFGRVSPAGKWVPSAKAEAIAEPLIALLKALSEDPAGTAAAYGKLTGNCCFCMSSLTDPKSTEVGYGPVCAKQYGLPWGEKPAAPAVAPTAKPLVADLVEVAEQEELVASRPSRVDIEFIPGQACQQLKEFLNA